MPLVEHPGMVLGAVMDDGLYRGNRKIEVCQPIKFDLF